MYLFCLALLIILFKYLNYLRVANATLSLRNKFGEINNNLYITI